MLTQEIIRNRKREALMNRTERPCLAAIGRAGLGRVGLAIYWAMPRPESGRKSRFQNMSKRASQVLAAVGYHAESSPAIAALVEYAAQNPGLDARNYFSDWRDKAGRAAYASDARSITRAWSAVREVLAEAGAEGVTDAHVIEASKSAFSGRLTWTGERWDYCTGQYWPTEYRRAVEVVLIEATRAVRRARPEQVGRIDTIDDLIYLNKKNGRCWFEPESMKFFGTRIESGIIRGRFFITSEQPPSGPRAFSVRSFTDKGDVNTVGEFCAYGSRADAKAAIPKD